MVATVFNRYENSDTGKVEWRRTILSGTRRLGGPCVHWENNQAANIVSSGLERADRVNVMIWLSADAEGRTYLPPKAYAKCSPAEAGRVFTFTPGKDYLLLGAVTGPYNQHDIRDVINDHDDCILISSVDEISYGRPHMHHFEIAGR